MSRFYWTTDKNEAKKEQQTLLNILKLESPMPNPTKFNCGLVIGSAYEKNTKKAFATAISINESGECIGAIRESDVEVDFPYIPGLLAFRVGPAICALLDNINDKIDILIFHGQGIAHPRGFGLASHIGVLYNKPSIGITKNALYGKYVDPPKEQFIYTEIVHPKKGIPIGYAVSLGESCSPCYVSPGHLIGLKDALKITCNITRDSCFPKTLKMADDKAYKNAKVYWQKQRKEME